MGTFFHPITLLAADGRQQTVNALVHTGAEFSMFPRSLLDRLGVRPHRRVAIRLPDGTINHWDVGRIGVRLEGEEEQVLCLFGAEAAPSLVGAHTLEAFLLSVDPAGKRLVPRIAYLMEAAVA